MDRARLIAQLDKLLPLAARWAEKLEARILRAGVPLSAAGLADARALGVREPERVRLLCLASVPTPDDPMLPRQSFDRVFLVHMYHEVQSPYAFLWHMREGLKPEALGSAIEGGTGNPSILVMRSIAPEFGWYR